MILRHERKCFQETYVSKAHPWAGRTVCDCVDAAVAPLVDVCIVAVRKVQDPRSCVASLLVVVGVGGAVGRECLCGDIGKGESGRKRREDGSNREGSEQHGEGNRSD